MRNVCSSKRKEEEIMAEKDKRTVKITDTSEQNETVSLWESFGWNLESAYDIVKEATPRFPAYHHVELNFQRDPSIPHYAELTAHEKAYDDTKTIYPDEPRFGWLIIIVLGLLLWVVSFASGAYYLGEHPFLTLILVFIPGIIITLLRKVIYKQKYAEAKRAQVFTDAMRAEILKAAQAVKAGMPFNLENFMENLKESLKNVKAAARRRLRQQIIVALAGTIAAFLLLRFVRINSPFINGNILADSIIAVLAVLFGGFTGGVVGFAPSVILNYPFFWHAQTQTLVIIAVSAVLRGLFGFLVGKIYHWKIKEMETQNMAAYMATIFGLIFSIRLVTGIIGSLGVSLVSHNPYPFSVRIFISSLMTGLISSLAILVYQKVKEKAK
jgi:MFS family permease